MLFDSASSGAAFSLEFAALKVIDQKSALPMRQYIIAGREGEHVPDPIGQSIFKRFLLKGLKGEADIIHDGYITGSELSYYITSTIGKVSGGRQHPQYAIIKNPALAGGDFVFIPGEIKTDTGRLFVETVPQSAQVKILNKSPLRPPLQKRNGAIVPYKGPQFKQGMELKPGKYQVEVSAAGYTNHKEWITLEAGEERAIDIQLQKSEEVTATGKATGEVSATGKATMELQVGSKATMIGNATYTTDKKGASLTHEQAASLEAGEGKGKATGMQIRKRDGVLINSLGMEFVLIKPGNFVMGSPSGNGAEAGDGEETGNGLESGTGAKSGNGSESGNAAESGNGSETVNAAGNGNGAVPYDEDEKEHLVTIKKGFHLQTTEVTVGQFRKFIQATGYVSDEGKKGSCWVRAEGGVWRQKKGIGWDSHRSWESTKYAQTEKHPVTCVSWNDAQAFIQWLSRKEGVTYELPTEAEWEYACRAGTTTPFSFGRCLSTDQADYGGGSGGGDSPSVNSLSADCRGSYRTDRHRPIEVGSLTPNPWKLFDMHGNVAEWCQDWYAPYPDTDMPVTDPKGPAGPSGGTERVMRGGHWAVNDQGCRSAKRWSFPPDAASEAIGFRLVMRAR